MRAMLIGMLALICAGCGQYNVVSAGPQTIGSLLLVPSQAWNRAPAMNSPGKVPTWTADGLSLNSLSFFADVNDGSPLISSGKEGEYPLFRADMLPDEIAQLVETTVAKMFQATITHSGKLAPKQFAGAPGFEYRFEMTTPDNLVRKAYAVGAVQDGRLQLAFYQGTRMVYFDKEFPGVEAMLATATLQK